MSDANKARSLEETPTWAVASVCFVLLAISIVIEHLIHIIGKWLQRKNRPALVEALEKVKAELMLMGFISLLLTVSQGFISDICIPKSVASTWHPCSKNRRVKNDSDNNRRRLLQFIDMDPIPRRSLATSKYDKCAEKVLPMFSSGKVAFVSAYGIHQLHIFIFVLAITCPLLHNHLCLGKKWKHWEDETKTIEYQYHNDPERFRFTRDTSFGRRHLKLWSRSPILLWIVCFFRQFFGSVNKIDYLTLRHGFITAHLAPGSERTFDFQKYIKDRLNKISKYPIIWFIAVLFLISNTYGKALFSWKIMRFVILVVGAKLQVIITQLGLRIQDRGDVGAPVVQPGDDLFWFGRPRLILFLIHLVLFQNAFQIAFFIWSVYEFTINSCFHSRTEDIVIRITMGVIIQFLCSYVTMPLYALVTQMGSRMRPTVFNDRVATALRNWHKTAKKHAKHGGRNSESHTPLSSRPTTPTYGMSPAHLLQNYRSSTAPDSLQASPRNYSYNKPDHWDLEAVNPVNDHETYEPQPLESPDYRDRDMPIEDPDSMNLPPVPPAIRTQHEVNISLAEFTFRK
ncbi:hypothetical protein K2173_014522 [Erythroxylum novogranatense]|uniref:MLO-like protein n=1 Tax=Erythroxylum novogranatense TaxID=1862640 RepID=A0AAV8S5G4_9ROSI|nr:hypothetical protein K2173_014522 [Erythroxylum novogranatense]